jgi:surface polysaccharide O-acyltransferase-like enzyme
MLTGSFALSNYKEGLAKFFVKLFKRIILPFIFWSIIYLFFYHGKDIAGHQLDLHQKISLIVHQILIGSAVHLWFVYMIVGLYLLIPFVSKWVKYCTPEEILFFLFLGLFFLIADPYLSRLDFSLDYSYFTGYIGYLILGNYLYNIKKKPNNILITLAGIATFIFTVAGTYIITKRDGEMSEYFFESLTPNIIVLSFCVYLLFKNVKISIPSKLQNGIDIICEHSYGIFLAHILILTLFTKWGLSYTVFSAWLSIPFIAILCFLISFATVYILKKIPYLKLLIG